MQLQDAVTERVSPRPRAIASPGRGPSRLPCVDVMLVHTDLETTGDPALLLERALAEAGLAHAKLHHASLGPQLWADVRTRSPRLVVAIGRPAAEALLGRTIRLSLERGRVMTFGDGRRLLLTESPAAVLGLPDAVARGREYRRLVNDLLHAVPYGRRAA
jgi:hypothetical protein